jgi:hypothetical protein
MRAYHRRQLSHFRFCKFRVLLGIVLGMSSLAFVFPLNAALIPPHGRIDLPGHGPIVFSPPTLVDLTGDGKQEILVGTSDGKVIVLGHTDSGTRLARLWSFDTSTVMGGPTSICGAISAGDLNGDGSLELVVPTGCTDAIGGIVVLNVKGDFLWKYFTQDHMGPHGVPDGLPDGVVSTPALGDLNNDGKLEIVFGGLDFRIHVLHHDGRVAQGWPKFVRDTIWSSPALADLDDDGFLEIIIGIDTHLEGHPFNTPDGGALYVFNFDGTIADGWPQFIDQVIYSSPAVGDLNGDGKLEIVHGTGEFYANPGAGYKIYTWDAKGNLLWTGQTNGYVRSSPTLGDITGDGKLEVVANSMEDGKTYAWKHDGTPLWSTRALDYRGEWLPLVESAMIADYDGDGKADIFTNVFWEAAVLHGSTGRQLTGTSLSDPRPAYLSGYTAATNTPALGDIDGDGKLELVMASANNAGTHAQVIYWDLPSLATPDSAPWPMFRQNPQGTGVIPVDTPLRSHVVKRDLPTVMQPDESQQITITYRNSGAVTWQPGNTFLKSVNGSDPFITLQEIPLPKAVAPGEDVTFTLNLTAPATQGYSTTDWRLVDTRSGELFGARVKVNIKIGNQPSVYILTKEGINSAGMATATMSAPANFTNWPAAHALKFTSDKRGYYLLDSYGGFWSGAEAFPLWPMGHRNDPQDFVLAPNGITYLALLGDGTVLACDVGPCHNPFSPATPTGIAARSLALTPDGKGIYVVDGHGNLYNGGTAPALSLPAGLPVAEDIMIRIKMTADGQGFYLLDRYGRVWAGGNALPLNPAYEPKLGEDWARDFEITEDGQGFYLLDNFGGIHAGGNAEPLSVNVPALSTDPDYARSLELVDSRIVPLAALVAVSATPAVTLVEQGNPDPPLFEFVVSSRSADPLKWQASAKWQAEHNLPIVKLSSSSGTLDPFASQKITVDAGDLSKQVSGTYPLEIEILEGNGDQNQTQTLRFTVIVADEIVKNYLPIVSQ